MRQRRREPDQAGRLVNRGSLDGGNLVPTRAFSDQIKPVCQRRVAEAAAALPSLILSNRIVYNGKAVRVPAFNGGS